MERFAGYSRSQIAVQSPFQRWDSMSLKARINLLDNLQDNGVEVPHGVEYRNFLDIDKEFQNKLKDVLADDGARQVRDDPLRFLDVNFGIVKNFDRGDGQGRS